MPEYKLNQTHSDYLLAITAHRQNFLRDAAELRGQAAELVRRAESNEAQAHDLLSRCLKNISKDVNKEVPLEAIVKHETDGTITLKWELKDPPKS